MLEIVVTVAIFILLFWAASIIPLPANAPRATRSVLYVLLILLAVAWLVTHYL